MFGVLVNNVWSFTGKSNRGPTSTQMTLQPFVNYNFPGGWYLTSSPIITADWEAGHGDRWTVPVGGGFGRVFKIGRQPVNAQLAAYYNVVKPTERLRLDDQSRGVVTVPEMSRLGSSWQIARPTSCWLRSDLLWSLLSSVKKADQAG